MIGYKTREFWIISSFILSIYGCSFAFLAPMDAPYLMALLAAGYCAARSLTKKNRAILVESALTEMIICGLTAGLLGHMKHLHFIDLDELWNSLAILAIGFTLSRGNGKGMTQAIKNHLPL